MELMFVIRTVFSPITSLLLWSAESADLLKKNKKNRWALLIWHLFPCLGVTPPALALWDINGDSVEDVFLGVTELTNDTHPSQGNKSMWGTVHKEHETFVSRIYFNVGVLPFFVMAGIYWLNPVYSAVALSALRGQVLWRKDMQESVMYIQCGLQYQQTPVVLLISKSIIVAVNGTSGERKLSHTQSCSYQLAQSFCICSSQLQQSSCVIQST